MFPEPIKCGAELGGGRKCEEIAKVVDIEFIYREEFEEGRFEQVLDEAQYTMECPKCGRWTRAETVHSNRTYSAVQLQAGFGYSFHPKACVASTELLIIQLALRPGRYPLQQTQHNESRLEFLETVMAVEQRKADALGTDRLYRAGTPVGLKSLWRNSPGFSVGLARLGDIRVARLLAAKNGARYVAH